MSTETFFQQLKHPNPNVRNQAMWGIADNYDAEVINRLMALLDEEDTTYRRAAVKTLGAIGHETVTPLVEALLNSDNMTVRSSAAKALAQVVICHPDEPLSDEGVQGLRSALQDQNPVVNIAAVMAMGEIGAPVVHLLIEALQTTENPALAVSLVNAIASTGDSRGIDVLQAIINDEAADSYVRETATSAISRLEMVAGFKRN
ncbi:MULTISPECIES: HEAT repeat domain-containing protein [Pseudanabaena]|jgi:bilin biosynthesis protein|uniref:HEAT repeat domain-containing protein n=1 Tax=Pseudanabaena TaxID=1152 RepID=UPI00247A7FD0|nr:MULTISPECIES: HEAT repeat domain-containing protein [Pseudanabaena]MEA5487214.1 HEAT repeat domain-containing protein [Pseudanabaena sp. CCNP1317]WGS70433.1 HEAT repeat domain-containing protein [Pseudanabaena galeata CCNP1313]